MPEFAATMTFEVVYRATQTELTTGERAHALADTMLAVLRGSAKVKVVEIQCDSVSHIEPLDDNHGLTQLGIKPYALERGEGTRQHDTTSRNRSEI